ncbi:alpha/beta fold hydrolase [Novosphingobium terrae]|uniref:alpha/beta fold hydrolase n=1 Tax=Novosphingobium terrae TaxID=2726189 RepID=UPI001F136D14|nr:alpha/beta hydrolase [Novosphingobium terrae]
MDHHPTYRSVDVDGFDIFYREAGDPAKPTILLLHGFPSSSHMFRELIPLLADHFHLVAPDLPGFGRSAFPAQGSFHYSFETIAHKIERFTEIIGLQRFAIYIFDYGAPTGLRMALSHPERITAIISQNGNAYDDGFGTVWEPIQRYWRDPSRANREALRGELGTEGIRQQYVHGVPDPSLISPDGWTLDACYTQRPGIDDIMLDLFRDYRTNAALYPDFQRYFRDHKPPLLAIWGKNDPIFVPAGALAFKRDLPDAQVHLLDTGHFALETHAVEIATRITTFLSA